MSSRANHINLENYEEYLLLYVDNELTASEKQMVEAFLVLHPALQMELDLLMSTRLPQDTTRFAGKQMLLAAQMKQDDIEEVLLNYLDQEVSPAEKLSIERQIAADPVYADALAALRKARLDPAEYIPFPHKQALYRSSQKTISIRWWMQVAAAVVLVVFFTALYMSNADKGGQSVASSPVLRPPAPVVGEQQPPVTVQVHDENSESALGVMPPPPPVASHAAQQPTGNMMQRYATSPEAPAEVSAESTILTSSKVIDISPVRAQAIDAPKVNLQIDEPIVTPVVTSAIIASYNNQEPAFAVSAEPERPKGSLKGFLRKATRLIERNTGIGATTNENELLIAALAVKL